MLETAGLEIPADGSALHRVSALALIRLAGRAPAGPADVVPDYLRLPDAEIAYRRRQQP